MNAAAQIHYQHTQQQIQHRGDDLGELNDIKLLVCGHQDPAGQAYIVAEKGMGAENQYQSKYIWPVILCIHKELHADTEGYRKADKDKGQLSECPADLEINRGNPFGIFVGKGLVKHCLHHTADSALQQGSIPQKLGDGSNQTIDLRAKVQKNKPGKDQTADTGHQLLKNGGEDIQFCLTDPSHSNLNFYFSKELLWGNFCSSAAVIRVITCWKSTL